MRKAATVAIAGAIAAAGIWVLNNGAETGGQLPYLDSDAVAAGQGLYQGYCASCHGDDLEGEGDWRQRDDDGYLPAPPHSERGHTWHHPDAQLIAITTYGSAALVGGGYKSRMAGYKDVLSEQEIREVLAYIKSTWPQDVIRKHNEINAAASG